MDCYLGIDLGGTNLKAGLFDSRLRLLAQKSLPIGKAIPPEEICRRIAALAENLLQAAGIRRGQVAWLGAAIPGTVDAAAGLAVRSANLGFDRFPIGPCLEEKTGLAVHLANDADAAAWGEYWPVRQHCRSLLMVTLGTGIGSGLVMDGRLFAGAFGGGLEAGHMIVQKEGRLCTCGQRGCWEAYASATGLICSVNEAISVHPASGLAALAAAAGQVDGKTAFDACRQGDPTARQVVEDYLDWLAAGLIGLINLLEPEEVVLSGGIAREGEWFLEEVRRRVLPRLYHPAARHRTLLRGSVWECGPGLAGAALLGFGMGEGEDRLL